MTAPTVPMRVPAADPGLPVDAIPTAQLASVGRDPFWRLAAVLLVLGLVTVGGALTAGATWLVFGRSPSLPTAQVVVQGPAVTTVSLKPIERPIEPPTAAVIPPPVKLPAVVTPEIRPTLEGALPLATMQQVKKATVFIKADSAAGNASGSGFLVLRDGQTGYVATNHHVVAPIRVDQPGPRFLNPRFPRPQMSLLVRPTLMVIFHSGTEEESSVAAEVVADDEEKDLAVLKVTGASELPTPIAVGANPPLVETMPVYLFGFPFGKALALNQGNPAITVGKGGVSSIRKDRNGNLALVQIDGDLNPGNSGGPVVDAQGRLVGVAVAKITQTNIGLAIPPGELDVVLQRMSAGRVASVSLARTRAEGTGQDVMSAQWLFDAGNKVFRSAGRKQRSSTAAPAEAKEDARASVVDEVQLVDPMHKLKGVGIAWQAAEGLVPPTHAGPSANWPELPNAQRQDLVIQDQAARGSVVVAVPAGADRFYFQVCYRTADDRTICTEPKPFHVNGTDEVASAPAPSPVTPNAPARNPARPMPDASDLPRSNLDELVADLEDEDFFRRNGALEKLKKLTVDEKRRGAVAQAVEPLLTNGDVFIHRNAAEVLGVWGRPESVPVLIERLGPANDDIFQRQGILKALGRLKDERAAGPVAECLRDFFLQEQAQQAIRAMGPLAEKAVVGLLADPEVETRMRACGLLGGIGTKESLAALELARRDSNKAYAQAAGVAIAAIKLRHP